MELPGLNSPVRSFERQDTLEWDSDKNRDRDTYTEIDSYTRTRTHTQKGNHRYNGMLNKTQDAQPSESMPVVCVCGYANPVDVFSQQGQIAEVSLFTTMEPSGDAQDGFHWILIAIKELGDLS